MSGFDFRRLGPTVSTDVAPLGRALQRWVRAHGGSMHLAELAAACSAAEAQGDSALVLDGERAARLDADVHAQLLLDPLCSDGSRMAPFVLQGERFYFWRNFAAETAVAADLAIRCAADASSAEASCEGWLDALFAGTDPVACEGQRAAVAAAARHRFLLLSGGPGTGKTSTVLRILLLLQRQSPRPLQMKLVAPTGKAAQRLSQALHEGRQPLLERLGGEWLPALEAMAAQSAQTLHRLLEFDPRENRFRRDARQRLDADVVVVDEASMVDLSLLRALLAALPAQARLLLVGDPEQLHSVAAGAVLADVGRALREQGRPQWQRLEHVFRAEAPLLPLLQAVRAGDAAALQAGVAQAPQAIAWRPVDTSHALAIELRRWSEALIAWQSGLPARIQAPAHAIAALRSFAERQLLCALREGEFGALACHRVIEQRLRHALGVEPGARWYHGQAIMITRNDYGHGLYNGDVGLLLADADGQLQAWFDTGDAGAGVRSFTPNALPAHEGAFALTIHKSQGSEYDQVAVLLPPHSEQQILSRQLLYTGLSRARRRVELWASAPAVEVAMTHSAARGSGLEARLAERLQALQR